MRNRETKKNKKTQVFKLTCDDNMSFCWFVVDLAMSKLLPLFPDDPGASFTSTAGGSFNEPVRDSDALTLRSFREYIKRYRIELNGTSRVYIDVKKSFGHLTVVVSPTQPGQLLGKYPFQKNMPFRAKPVMPLKGPRVGGNELLVEWSDSYVEICKIREENDGIYDVTVILE